MKKTAEEIRADIRRRAIETLRNGLGYLRSSYEYKEDGKAFADFVDTFIDDFGLPNLLRAVADRERLRGRATLDSGTQGCRSLALSILATADEIAMIANRVDSLDAERDGE